MALDHRLHHGLADVAPELVAVEFHAVEKLFVLLLGPHLSLLFVGALLDSLLLDLRLLCRAIFVIYGDLFLAHCSVRFLLLLIRGLCNFGDGGASSALKSVADEGLEGSLAAELLQSFLCVGNYGCTLNV